MTRSTIDSELKKSQLKELRTIPGVGASISQDLWELGIRSVGDLRGKDPEQLYEKHYRQAGMHLDRCLLYVYRCAVYFASTKNPKPELLLWWNWRDRK